MRVIKLLGATRVEVEGNARVVIGLLRDGESGGWRYDHIMVQFRRLLAQRKVVFNWMSRVGN